MRKYLAVFAVISFLLLNFNFTSLAVDDHFVTEESSHLPNVTEHSHKDKKLTDKKSSKSTKSLKSTKTENSSSKLSKSYYGFKEIVQHPFAICVRGFFWGVLGHFIPYVPHGKCIFFLCGAVSKGLEFYEVGCQNAPV